MSTKFVILPHSIWAGVYEDSKERNIYKKPSHQDADFFCRVLGKKLDLHHHRSRRNKERVVKNNKDVNHDDSADLIARKAKLLLTPKVLVENRGVRATPTKPTPDRGEKSGSPRVNIKKTRLSPTGAGARFETVSLGYAGVLYDCYQGGKAIVVQWNIDHPFYERVILANKSDKNIVSALDYLVFGFAAAEMRATTDDNSIVLNTIKSEMSSNLRSLLS